MLHLYEVRLSLGKSNNEYLQFIKEAEDLNCKYPDYNGFNGVCIISTPLTKDHLYTMLTVNMQNTESITINEITTESIDSDDSSHRLYADLINNYFLRYNNYPNIT